MLLNSQTMVIGTRVILVPYKTHHVQKYHGWMQNEELRTLTASDALSEQQEYEMQLEWANDESKCTFIVLDEEKYFDAQSEEVSMIGDVNLYLSYEDGVRVAECGVMIAEENSRGKGMGVEAMTLMIKYGCEYLNIGKYVAKISFGNDGSVKLFEKIGFTLESTNSVFKELEYIKYADSDFHKYLHSINWMVLSNYGLSDHIKRMKIN